MRMLKRGAGVAQYTNIASRNFEHTAAHFTQFADTAKFGCIRSAAAFQYIILERNMQVVAFTAGWLAERVQVLGGRLAGTRSKICRAKC
jgi:hypothetical protein